MNVQPRKPQVTIAAWLLLSAGVSLAQPTPAELETRWRSLERRESVESTYTVTQEYTLAVPSRPRRHFEWQVENGDSSGRVARGTSEIVCWNEKYCFGLMTKEGATDLILTQVTLGAPKENNQTFSLFTKSNFGGHLIRPYTFLLDDTISGLMTSGKMKISSVTSSGDVVKVIADLRFVNTAKVPMHYALALEVYPDDGRLRQVIASRRNDDGSTIATRTLRYSYAPSVHGPVIERIEYVDDLTPDGVLRFSNPAPRNTPPEAYRLSHYSFPEPEGVVWETQWSVPLWVWLIVAAGGFATLALLLTWLRFRRSPGQPYPSTPTPKPGKPQV